MFKVFKKLQFERYASPYLNQYGIQFRVRGKMFYVKVGVLNLNNLGDFDYEPYGTMVDWWDNEGRYNYEN